MNKKKIINDPVYGFINVPTELLFDLIEHPFFQRLHRIRQLGLTYYVYPGAIHTRFHHAIGAMHLMQEALESLKSKGYNISDEECEAAMIAILLHDVGHGPFSHALEHSIVKGLNHEEVSLLFMQKLNGEFNGKLQMAIDIFSDKYSKKFLHQLVSSQLDIDRLDYLNRDSFFTGVVEGMVSSERIIKMLEIENDNLVVHEKGIYSIEKFIIARRLMYWQVYLHKTVLSAEKMLENVLKRAKELANKGNDLFCTPALHHFLYNTIAFQDFLNDDNNLNTYAALDDYDVFTSIKVWQNHPDTVLSELCKALTHRELFKVRIQNDPFNPEQINAFKNEVKNLYGLNDDDANYFVLHDELENSAYNSDDEKIHILYKNGRLLDIATASDQLNIATLAKPVKKYFLCVVKSAIGKVKQYN
ncbi:MAG: HD domain-containing protein [Bacteroidia bacterium]|nr:HD domain-containing protein [Bacteroidia bacterium]NNM16263.1 HD domain-containing protein [Bacteroidia bacterium]